MTLRDSAHWMVEQTRRNPLGLIFGGNSQKLKAKSMPAGYKPRIVRREGASIPIQGKIVAGMSLN